MVVYVFWYQSLVLIDFISVATLVLWGNGVILHCKKHWYKYLLKIDQIGNDQVQVNDVE